MPGWHHPGPGATPGGATHISRSLFPRPSPMPYLHDPRRRITLNFHAALAADAARAGRAGRPCTPWWTRTARGAWRGCRASSPWRRRPWPRATPPARRTRTSGAPWRASWPRGRAGPNFSACSTKPWKRPWPSGTPYGPRRRRPPRRRPGPSDARRAPRAAAKDKDRARRPGPTRTMPRPFPLPSLVREAKIVLN